MFVSPELQQFMGAAAQIASRSRHEFFLPEHIALALISSISNQSQTGTNEHQKIVDSIKACGASINDAQNALQTYLDVHVDKLPDNAVTPGIFPTQGVARVINQSLKLANLNNRAASSPLDYWLAFLEDNHLDGPMILGQIGVNSLKVKEFLAHNIVSKTSSPFPEHETLSPYGTHLTLLAAEGKLDPVIGRDADIEAMSMDLLRRRKKNVLLVGEPGVGKTAVVEGLAQQIQDGVFKRLKGKRIWSIDTGSLIAGTRFRGDFEDRLKKVVNIAEQNPDVILFIDEIHTLIGMGAGQSGNMDAANLLKPALARGSIQLIGATTETEARNIFEKDKALRRRFVKRTIAEPTEEVAVLMIKAAIPHLAKHHNVKFAPDVAKTAVSLAKQYIRELRLPDSALDIIDHLGSRKQDSKAVLTSKDIAEALSSLVAKPITLSNAMKKTPSLLKDGLSGMVFGQDQAIETIYKSMVVAQAGLNNPDQPLGSFLFTGPTGVGKTELAKQLATQLHAPLIQFDLSEFQEAHSVSKVIGSPPGYVGHDEGGQVTAAVRKNPSCILLLDEFEKAHPAVHRLFLQILDHGTLTDSQGEMVDFRKCVIIFTTNTGADTLEKRSIGFGASMSASFDATNALKEQFPPEFRNRLSAVVSFNPLGMPERVKVVKKFLNTIQERLGNRMVITFDDEFCATVAELGTDPLLGARPLDRWLTSNVRTPLAEYVLTQDGKKLKPVQLAWNAEENKVSFH